VVFSRLLAQLPESHRGVAPFRTPIVRDVRVVLYAVSRVSDEHHIPHDDVAEWRQIPVWACVSQPVSQGLTHDASDIPSSPTHSHLLEASPLLAGSLSPSRPGSPVLENHSFR
jgi:hypothetical protein